jgi:NAD(P)H-dependent flavin oxidoreductase YrpB (nitropropane dioxygenase family)
LLEGLPGRPATPAGQFETSFSTNGAAVRSNLTADAAARAEYRQAEQSGDMRVVPVWAGEAIDLITESLSATDVVRTMVSDAEETLRRILNQT